MWHAQSSGFNSKNDFLRFIKIAIRIEFLHIYIYLWIDKRYYRKLS